MIFPYPVFQLCVWFVCYIRCFLCLYLASFNGMACICIYFAWFSPRFAFPLLTNKATNELMRWNLVGFIAVFVFYFVCFPVFKLYFIVFTTCQRFFLYRHLYTVFYVWFSRVYAFVNHSLLKYKVCSNKHVARLHFFCVLDFHCLSLFISISLSLWFVVRIFFILWFVWKIFYWWRVQPNKQTAIQLTQKIGIPYKYILLSSECALFSCMESRNVTKRLSICNYLIKRNKTKPPTHIVISSVKTYVLIRTL